MAGSQKLYTAAAVAREVEWVSGNWKVAGSFSQLKGLVPEQDT